MSIMDKLRVCKIEGMSFPPGMPVKFQGNVVGKTIAPDKIMVNNDTIYRMIQGDKVSIGLEVVRK